MAADSSAKRDSIWPTSPSITAARVPLRSGDDFDAQELLGCVLARRLDGEDRVHGGDGDRELVEVGLAGRQLLQHEARPHDHADPTLAAASPGPTNVSQPNARASRGAGGAAPPQPQPTR